MNDKQTVRENLVNSGVTGQQLEDMTERFVALLASRALEEAKWWEHLAAQAHEESCGSKTSFDPKGCMYCERIAALEQAAASKEGK